MFLEMQDFDFALEMQDQILPHVLHKFAQFCPKKFPRAATSPAPTALLLILIW